MKTMRSAACRFVSVGMVLLLSGSIFNVPVQADRRRDPLNQLEIDQLRDTAQEPELRLRLYIKFARTRLDAIEQARSDPKVTDKAQQTHDRLQDFLDVYDELNDNVDTYADRKSDLRKALKIVIDADTEFQAKLRALKGSATATPAETQEYDFLLNNALDTVDSSAQDHRQLLAEQDEAAKHKRPTKNTPAEQR
jgi:septal ring factor EnvC (AmiA/AmiB activator)